MVLYQIIVNGNNWQETCSGVGVCMFYYCRPVASVPKGRLPFKFCDLFT